MGESTQEWRERVQSGNEFRALRLLLRSPWQLAIQPHLFPAGRPSPWLYEEPTMKVRNSLRSAKTRDKNCQIVKRKGRIYLINKKNPRFKARQG